MCLYVLYGLESKGTDNIQPDENLSQKAIIEHVKKFVEKKFADFYKNYNIEIMDISIKPAINANLNKMTVESIKFDDKLLKSNEGNFEVNLKHNEKKQRIFFTFNINASIDALLATSNIKTGEVLSEINTENTRMQVSRLLQLPSNIDILNNYQAKSFISMGSIIINSKITPKIIVNKGEVISVRYKSNGIEMIFDAKALEDGAINQNIKAQSVQGGKDIKIKIFNAKEALLQ